MSEDGKVKSLELAQEETIQERGRKDEDGRGGGFLPLLSYMVRAGELIAPWWSKRRDRDLDGYWKKSDHVSGAFYTLAARLSSVPFRVEARTPGVKAHRRLAEEYQENLESASQWGQGWQDAIIPWLMDLWSQDNGAFFEIIGGGDKGGELEGLAVGLAHLDSFRCDRTGDAEFPVVYDDTDGRRYKLHRTRVAFTSQLPSARSEMYSVGFCWMSRAINAAQSLIDDALYKQEKMGSRPNRGIAITKGGLDPEDVQASFMQASSVMDSQLLARYSKLIVLGDSTLPEADLSLIDLASLPDGFDYETDLTLGMFTLALTGAVPPRWLWPATSTGATKADAEFQHVAGLVSGPGSTLRIIQNLLGGPEKGSGRMPQVKRYLPPQLRLVFDFQDDAQDQMSALIDKTRSETRERDVNNGVITLRVAREKMLQDGDLTPDQFIELEVGEGRLETGDPVLNLFFSPDADIQAMLDIGVDDPLSVLVNDPVEALAGIEEATLTTRDILINSPNEKEQRRAREALKALEQLKVLYLEQAIGPEEIPEEEASEDETEEDEQETEDQEENEEEATQTTAESTETTS